MNLKKLIVAIAITSFRLFIDAFFKSQANAVYLVTSETIAETADPHEDGTSIQSGTGLTISKLSDAALSAGVKAALDADGDWVKVTGTMVSNSRWEFLVGSDNLASQAYNDVTRKALEGFGELLELTLQGRISALTGATMVVIDQITGEAWVRIAPSAAVANFPAVAEPDLMVLEGFTRSGIGWGEAA